MKISSNLVVAISRKRQNTWFVVSLEIVVHVHIGTACISVLAIGINNGVLQGLHTHFLDSDSISDRNIYVEN